MAWARDRSRPLASPLCCTLRFLFDTNTKPCDEFWSDRIRRTVQIRWRKTWPCLTGIAEVELAEVCSTSATQLRHLQSINCKVFVLTARRPKSTPDPPASELSKSPSSALGWSTLCQTADPAARVSVWQPSSQLLSNSCALGLSGQASSLLGAWSFTELFLGPRRSHAAYELLRRLIFQLLLYQPFTVSNLSRPSQATARVDSKMSRAGALLGEGQQRARERGDWGQLAIQRCNVALSRDS